ncbi:ABC transporter permease subunit [Candidatus Latescibacterota bacterium]
MILSIALKDFYNNLVSARFIIGFILCILIIPVILIVSINDYKSQVQAYEVERTRAEERDQIRVYSAFRPDTVKQPEPLSIFCKGISQNVGNRVRILFGEKPLLSAGRSSVRENPHMNAFFTIDFISVIAILLSLLALLFTYDTCSGEKEEGTFKLVFSNPVSRYKILLGKFLGVSFTIFPIILICYVLSIIIILLNSNLSFSPGDYVRIIILLVLSILYFMIFMSLGIFISTRARSSVTSIIICMFVWVTLMFIIPNLAVYAAQSFVNVRSQENLSTALGELNREFDEKCDEYRDKIRTPDIWFMHFNHNTGGDGFQRLVGAADKAYEFYRELNSYCEPLRVDYADRKWPVQKAYLDELESQRILAETISLLSPSEVFRLAASKLCKTDVDAHNRFLDTTQRYREELIQFFNDEKIFDSYEYFTPVPPEYFMTADNILQIITGGKFNTLDEYRAWAKNSAWIFAAFTESLPDYYVSSDFYQPLDLSHVPKFNPKPLGIIGTLKQSIIKIGMLMLISIILFYLSYISFAHYDVR